VIDITKIADAEQQAEIATLQRDLGIAQSQLRNLREKIERLEADNEDLSQRLLRKARREGESSVLMDRLSNLRVNLREMERARDEHANQVAGLQVMVQSYEAQLGGNEDAIDPDEFEALKTELETLREKSRKELQDLQDQLDRQSEKTSRVAVDSESVLEVEVLRQEHDVLTHSLSDRQSELQASQQTCQLLEDELEDAHAEIDELRRQLEKYAEDIEKAERELEKKNAETVAEILAENIEKEDSFHQSVPVLDIDSASASGLKKKLSTLVLGLVLGIILMEVLSLALGKGEVFQYLSQDSIQQHRTPDDNAVRKPVKPVDKDQQMQSGQIIRN
jgi:chromosome segregation ATPase